MSHSSLVLQKQSWKQLASVQVGGAICLPLLLVGYELAKQGHPLTMLCAILWGNLLLFGLAVIAGWMSHKRPFTTAEYASFYFGSAGRLFFALILALSMLGWFAIQTQCMGQDVYHLVHTFTHEVAVQELFWKQVFSFILAALMIGGAFWGLNFLTSMANLCIPLLLVTIGYAVYAVGAWHLPQLEAFSFWDGKGVSLVLASSMAATIDLPSFYRHADHPKAALWASLANYLIVMPLIQIAGMWLYYGTQAVTMSEALASPSAVIWKIWVVIFMLLAGWTTNNVNLYSAYLSLTNLSKRLSFSTTMALTGLIGMALVFTPALTQFAQVLDLIGILVVAMGGVMLMVFVLESYGLPTPPLIAWSAWSAGMMSGFYAFMWSSPFGSDAPVLDAGIGAMSMLIGIHISHYLLKTIRHLFKEKKNESCIS